MHSSKLKAAALKLLRDRPRTLSIRRIAEETGLPEAWLWSFNSDRNSNPGVVFVETLYRYLSKREFDV
jgi:hypothetical protein